MFRSEMTLDGTHRVLTAVASALLFAGAAGFFVVRPGGLTGIVSVFLVAVFVVTWALSPCALVVDGAELRIERRAMPPVCVDLASVASVAQVDAIGPGTVRVFGVGGLFGSYGLFWNKSLGRFRVFATRRRPVVLLRLRDGGLPIVVTPDDAKGMIAALERR
jgi:hypothetical protein